MAMVESMRHESYYRTGTFSAPKLGVYTGWVGLPDAFAGEPVVQNETRDVALVFSGECFFEPEAKTKLRQQGHEFAGQGSDCLPHWYEEQGDAFFANLNGFFSSLLIDQRQQQVTLFNDRYGLDRIYWHETADAFYFASEAKALLRVLPELRAFDPEGIAQYFSGGSAREGRTLFQKVQLLPGAARWTFSGGGVRRETYFSPRTWESQATLPVAEYERQFIATFQRIAPKYFTTELPLGVALTGGLDTRMFMACLPQLAVPPVCYTFTGPAGETMDDRVAARVAKACGLSHQLLRLNPDFFSNFASHADRTTHITDGSSSWFGAHEIYFHRQARQLAPVRLTGNYGGEILRAVSTFKPLGLASELFDSRFQSTLTQSAQQLVAARQHPVTFAAFQEMPWSLFGNLAAGRSQIQFRTPYLDNELVALAYQCPPELRKSSLPAVRLVKASNPALDAIATDRGVVSDHTGGWYALRRAFEELTFKLDYHSDAGLPRKLAVLNPIFKPVVTGLGFAGRHKFLKYSTWLRGPLAPLLPERLAAAAKVGAGYLDADYVGQLAGWHKSGRKNLSAELNAVLTLESIERQLLRGLPRGF